VNVVHPEPLEVRHEQGARRVVLAWDDGHASPYPLDYLRSWCPCAGCQGHTLAPRYLDLVGQELVRIAPVGNYGVSFAWQDGHDTGIYTFRYLRALCPCPDCGGEKL
jgi:DUF971 family protein